MGRFSGLATALSTVADDLRKQRELGQEARAKKNLLGYEGLIKGTIAPSKEGEQGAFNMPGVGRVKQVMDSKEWKPQTQEEALGFEKAKAGLKGSLTLSNALGILSDPFKARQLKRTYPKLYEEAENVVKSNLGEDVLTKMIPPLKTPGKITKTSPDTGNIMDTNW